MVSFVCNACGQTVKKQKVEKHYQTECRSCEVLSCIDCGKDFPGDSYAEHTSCITEAEKYQGKLYKPKDKANKGERKQQEWIEKVRNASDIGKQDPRIRKIMARITACNNVPRKENKFKKFCENSINVRDANLRDKLWEVFSGVKNSSTQNDEKNTSKAQTNTNDEGIEDNGDGVDQNTVGENTVVHEVVKDLSADVDESKGEKSKKKKKMESVQKDNLKETVNSENGVTDLCEDLNQNEKQKLKKKKKKLEKGQGDTISTAENGVLYSFENSNIANGKKLKSKKNKKRKNESEQEDSAINETEVARKKQKMVEDDFIVNQNVQDKVDERTENHIGKFRWETVIKKLLKSAPDNEMSVKKLRKKVLNEYAACGGDSRPRTEQELRVLFEKKLHKNPKVKVLKEKAKYCK